MHPRGLPPPASSRGSCGGGGVGECSPTPPLPLPHPPSLWLSKPQVKDPWLPCGANHIPRDLVLLNGSVSPPGCPGHPKTKAKSPRCRAGITPPRASRSLGITRPSPHWGTKPHPRSRREQVRPPGGWTLGPRGPIWKDTPPAPGCAAAGPRQGLTRSLQGWGLRKDLRLSQRLSERPLLPPETGTASTSTQAAPACPPLAQVQTPSGTRVTAQSL